MKYREHRLHYIDMYPQPVIKDSTVTNFLLSRKFKYFVATLILVLLFFGIEAAVGGTILGGLILWWNKEPS